MSDPQINLSLQEPKQKPVFGWHLPALAAGVFFNALVCFILAFYFTNQQTEATKNSAEKLKAKPAVQASAQAEDSNYDFIGELAYRASVEPYSAQQYVAATTAEKNSKSKQITAAAPATEADPTKAFAAALTTERPVQWQDVPSRQPKEHQTALPPAPAGAPKIAIVIDDLGVMGENSALFLQLPPSITFAFLPYGHSTLELAKKSHRKGHDVMIHLPMEPFSRPNGERLDPGPHALYTTDSNAMITQKMAQNMVDLAPYAVGVNNHMGSAFTANQQKLTAALTLVAAKNMFFMDSVTSNKSKVKEAVDELRKNGTALPLLSRDVFLDHVIERKKIDDALKKTEKVARERGSAIAIGHPYKVTLDALQAWLPTLEKKGIYVVPITHLLPPSPKAAAQPTSPKLAEPTTSTQL